MASQVVQDAERDVFAAQDRVAELLRQVKAETDAGRHRVLQLRLQDAHKEEERATLALFAVMGMAP